MKYIFLTILLSVGFAAQVQAQKEVQKKIQTQLILAEDGAVVELDEGSFTLTGSLSMEDKKNVVIRGKGVDKTILSFKGQLDGAEGLRVSNCQHIVIENLTVQDTKGDAIKTMNVNGITFRNVKTEWTGKPRKENGSYGLYPVQCQNVLIEGCTAVGASDAGIYVGQSKYIIVRNSKAYHNVAGIEIENSLYADVYDNESTENTGGILVFDLPDLVQKKGGGVRVFRNNIHHNNLANFAPKGNIVGKVLDGTGILILATNNVEIFDNQVINNNTVSTGIISYYMTENPINDKEYYPYPTGIHIHDNTYERAHVRPSGKGRMGKMYRFKLKFGKEVPHIQYDGIVDASVAAKPEARICIRNNKGASFVNMDAGNDFKGASRDSTPYNCSLSAIEAAKLTMK
ncbi:MAG: parallel beta-helix domain-containing protein [Spirosomataceae bacterium]